MDYVRLGSTGLKVSRLCLGCMTYGSKKWREWVLEEEESRPFFRRALEAGINFFDTADMYSIGVSEEITGRALKEFAARDRVVIATKVFNPMGDDPNQRGLSRKHIHHAIDDSLRRLGTDYVDLYQIHRFDYDTPIEETLRALDDVVRAGKALYIGASCMYAWQFAKMLARRRRERPGALRHHAEPLQPGLSRRRARDAAAVPRGRHRRHPVESAGPRLSGRQSAARRISAKPSRAKTDDYAQKMYYQPSDFAVVERVTEIARQRGVPNAQVALAWVLQQPGVTAPIIGASKMHHLDDAVAALDVKLDAAELKALAEPYQPHRVLGHS